MGKHHLRQVACVFAAVLASMLAGRVASGATDPALQAPPTVPPLSGEQLNSTSFTRIWRTCNPDGSGEESFSAVGLATGPYTGTFTESGTITYGPRDPLSEDSVVTSAQIDFTINSASPPATITGHKSIGATTRAQSFARCDLFGEAFTVAIVFALPYTASIETLGAVCTTSGTAYTEVLDFDVAQPFEPNELREDFNPDGTAPVCRSTAAKATGGGYIDPLTGEAVDLATMLIRKTPREKRHIT